MGSHDVAGCLLTIHIYFNIYVIGVVVVVVVVVQAIDDAFLAGMLSIAFAFYYAIGDLSNRFSIALSL